MESSASTLRPEVNAICHLEWECSDHSRTRRFYEGLLGWKFTDGFGNLIFCSTSKGHLGAFAQVENVRPAQSTAVYFTVQEIEPYTESVAEFGGTVFSAKHEVPGVGWSACLADPDGNLIGLVKFAEQLG